MINKLEKAIAVVLILALLAAFPLKCELAHLVPSPV